MAEVRRTRIINTSRILRGLWVNRQISRVQLARDLGLNKSTISMIVGDLLEKGLIIEAIEGAAGPQGGRKPVHIELNKRFGYVLGIEIRPESYTVVAVDLAGDILFSRTEWEDHTGDSLLPTVRSLIQNLQSELTWIKSPILGVGLGISGIVDGGSGTIMGSIPLNVSDPLAFSSLLEQDFDFPIFVENDANCCAWGELAFHRTMKMRNFLFTLVEFHTNTRKHFYENTSVGFGIVIGGQVYAGSRHSAGEFRSILCKTEDRGQFRTSSVEGQVTASPDLFQSFVKELSQHLALFVNTFNLSQLFLGGDIEQYQEVVKPILMDELRANWVYADTVDCDVRFSSLGDKSVAYGAAGFVLERLFADPETIQSGEQWTEREEKSLSGVILK